MKQDNTTDKALKYIKPLLPLIEAAANKGAWSGLDGVLQYIQNPRLETLKEQNAKVYNTALLECFKAVIKGADAGNEPGVIKQFKEEYKEPLHKMANAHPEKLKENSKLAEHCADLGKGSSKFRKMVAESREVRSIAR